jgi:uncharacterized protein YqgC (DUF456 family)
MKDRYLLILLAVLLVVMVGVFFLYVPILPAIASIVVLLGLIAMFSLGYHVGQNSPVVSVEIDTMTPDVPLPLATVPGVRERFRDVA